jgi:N-hydroxyarylamine O-acetyltransferase
LDIEKYLSRINYKGDIQLNHKCLSDIHECHAYSIPFETLDIHIGRPINLELDSVYEKVISNKRGGFCYELNYLFFTLLVELGFKCSMISSRIWNEEVYGPPFDHMSLKVDLDDEWLLDVGFGDLFIRPLKIKDQFDQEDKFNTYRIKQLDKTKFLLFAKPRNDLDFEEKYEFDTKPRVIGDFQDQCDFKQYSPESHFVKKVICTIPISTGRKSLTNDSFTKKIGNRKDRVPINSPIEFNEVLKREFSITLYE